MKLDFRDGTEDFTDLQKEYAEYLLSGVELNASELEAKFGPALDSLENNFVIRKYVADEKIKRKSKKQLVDQLHLDKLVKVIPMSIKALIEGLQSDDEAVRTRVAMHLLKPSISYLDKLAINSADSEFDFDLHGNVISVDEQDKAL